jgi:hypothetical protein
LTDRINNVLTLLPAICAWVNGPSVVKSLLTVICPDSEEFSLRKDFLAHFLAG